jgi:hypothetical protein
LLTVNKNLTYHKVAQPPPNFALATASLLQTVNIDMTPIKAWAILDSGATSNFLTTNAPVTNVQPANKPLVVQLPNGAQVQSTHTCLLNLSMLPAAARQAHIIPRLASHSLISVITLTNARCKVHFTKNWLYNHALGKNNSVQEQMHVHRPVDDTSHHITCPHS